MKLRVESEMSRLSSWSEASTLAMARLYSFFKMRSVIRLVLTMKFVNVRSPSTSAEPLAQAAERSGSIMRPRRYVRTVSAICVFRAVCCKKG